MFFDRRVLWSRVSTTKRHRSVLGFVMALAVLLGACGTTSTSAVAHHKTTTTGVSLATEIARLPTLPVKSNSSVHALSVPVPYGSGSFVVSSSGRALSLQYLEAANDSVADTLSLPTLLPRSGASALSISGPALIDGVGWILVGNELIKISLPPAGGTVSPATVGILSTARLNGLSGISGFLVADASHLFVAGARSSSNGISTSVLCDSVSAASGAIISSTTVRGSQVLSLVAGGQSVWLTSETQGGVSSGPEVVTNAIDPLDDQVTLSHVVSKSGEYALMTATAGRTWGALFSGLAFAPSSFVMVTAGSTLSQPSVLHGVLGEVNDAVVGPSGSTVWTIGPQTLLGFNSSTLHRVYAYRLGGVLGTSIAVGTQSIWITANHEVLVVSNPRLG